VSSAPTTPAQATAPGPRLDRFEALDVDIETFDHSAHLYVAWQYVRRYDLVEAIVRYRDTLKRLTASIGIPEKYHETITWFFIILVAERVRLGPEQSWDAFCSANSDLFSRQPGIIRDYYPEATLRSGEARAHFVLPSAGYRRAPAPAA
jgi:hypothetical protein